MYPSDRYAFDRLLHPCRKVKGLKILEQYLKVGIFYAVIVGLI